MTINQYGLGDKKNLFRRFDSQLFMMLFACIDRRLFGGILIVFAWFTQIQYTAPAQSPSAFSPDATANVSNEQSPTPPSIDPNALVLQALEQSVWGPSFSCQIRQRTKLYDHEMVGVGQYWHAGEGTGKLETYVRFAVADSFSNLIQVSDGRLMWTSTRANEPLRKVHLDRVRQAFPNMGRGSNRPDVAMYLAIGGQPEMLRMLYLRYRWYKAYAGTYRTVPVWQLIGTLRTQPPSITSAAPIDGHALRTDPPKEIPTDVRLTLGREGEFISFPFQIEYFVQKPDEENRERLVPFSTVEYYDYATHIDTSKLFRYEVQKDVDQIEDETALYLPPTQITRAKDRSVR
jgi:hypothetical protein